MSLLKAYPHFEGGDKNKVNCRQTKKITQTISRYLPVIRLYMLIDGNKTQHKISPVF